MAEHRVILPSDLPETEIQEEFFCSSAGPGGQNVNRTANSVRLIFFASGSSLLDDESRERLYKSHVPDSEGNIAVVCRESRSLQLNRTHAREILAQWITLALKKPLRRKKTKPTKASCERRLKEKSSRSKVKALRSSVKNSSSDF